MWASLWLGIPKSCRTRLPKPFTKNWFVRRAGADDPQVIAEQIVKAEALLGVQVLFAFEQEQRDFFSTERKPSRARRRDSPGWI